MSEPVEPSRRALFGLAAAGVAAALTADTEAQGDPQTATSGSQVRPTAPAPPSQGPAPFAMERFESDNTFPRLPEEQVAWKKVVETLTSRMQLTSNGTSAGDLSQALRRIESGFAFVAAQEDSDFSFLHIEPLLDQAADLLDRGIRDRAIADDQSAKMVQLLLEIHEFAELDRIHHLEEAGGLYDTPYLRSSAEANAEAQTKRSNEYYKRLTEWVMTTYYSQAAMNEQSAAAQKAGWLAGLLAYTFKDQTFTGYVGHTFDGVADSIARHGLNAAFKQSYHRLFVDSASLTIQAAINNGNAQSADFRFSGANAQAVWDSRNRSYARERTRVSRRIEDIKARAATDPDGVLNYAKRVLDIKARFQQDFRDAIARLRVVADGMNQVYGYSDPLPADETSLSYFDDCLLWTRRTIQWLIRFSRQEQSFIVPVSVRDLAGKKEWAAGKKVGRWRIPISVSLFPDLVHLRLRGIGAVTVEDSLPAKDGVLWRLNVRAPITAAVHHLGGHAGSLNQSKVPPCRLARVTRRHARLEPDVVGVSALHNSSPLGDWTVEIAGAVPAKHSVKDIEDIVLDLHVAYRAKHLSAAQA